MAESTKQDLNQTFRIELSEMQINLQNNFFVERIRQ